MLPTYKCPTIPTIQEPPSEQPPLADLDHVLDVATDQANEPPPRVTTASTTTTRLTSTKRDHLGRSSYYRSASPQLHHFLKANNSPAAENELSRASHGRGSPSSRRRYSAADLALLKSSSIRANTSLPLDCEGWGLKHLSPSSAANQARIPSIPALPRSAASHRRASLSTIPHSNDKDDKEDRIDLGREESIGSGHDVASIPPAGEDWPRGRETENTAAEGISSDTMLPPSLDLLKALMTTSSSSPTAKSNSSSRSSTSSSSRRHSVASSEKTTDTDLSLGEDHVGAVGGDETPIAPAATQPPERLRAPLDKHHSHSPERDRYYGTPEMPRGSAKLPHISAQNLTPRVPNQTHPKHLPRAEKLPLSGYELLASTISSSSSSAANQRCRASAYPTSASFGPPHKHGSRRNSTASFVSVFPSGGTDEQDHVAIKPIYRRFEALNHRLLLHLQDELGELEEQLHRLDTTDTQTRRVQNHILPASRRAEFLAGGELQWHKTDILDKIAFKLGQYNHVLTSFTATRDLPAPSPSDIDDYQTYLATRQPISEDETRFLDSAEDLVTLAASEECSPISSNGSPHSSMHHETRPAAQEYLQSLHHNTTSEEPTVTPIPGTMHGNSWLVRHNRLSIGSRSSSGIDSATSISPRSTTRPQPLEPLIASHPSVLSTQQLMTSASLPPQHHRGVSRGVMQVDPSTLTTETRKTPEPVVPSQTTSDAALTMAGAVLLPMLGFTVIPGFVGRMAVVLLVGLWAFNSMAVLGVWRAFASRQDIARDVGAYVAVMAVVAGCMG
ncbi:hypothetical protein M406DRAFT_73983 [Cryphonectria parasitica EP155]|uniref:DUF6594 domain-containing protein n=1 Tax=Cryphonectria parasitica (strain ATCC 38755 / EP155) TaxID=660469 RepID=A0A9P5CMK8_CRYP1|nr:uncharacterized protein M406DRAFT_73983 [Cryphonectria parasitica EP155]KAF3763367.1 hypothetical protein M406DRAFT_73983 [Cryphonectria parasitica EP155]